MNRSLTVADTIPITGRGTGYIVKAGDPPYVVGERVYLHGLEFEITGVEMLMTNPPKPVWHGYQTILLKPVVTP